jgi:transcriptional regulator GlxA family with amidase domain
MLTDRAPRKPAIQTMKQLENSKQAAKMYDLAVFISAHADSSLSLSSLAKKAGLSPSHLQRVFKAVKVRQPSLDRADAGG